MKITKEKARAYGNTLKKRRLDSYTYLRYNYLDFIATWDKTLIRELYYSATPAFIKRDIREWERHNKPQVACILQEILEEREAV